MLVFLALTGGNTSVYELSDKGFGDRWHDVDMRDAVIAALVDARFLESQMQGSARLCRLTQPGLDHARHLEAQSRDRAAREYYAHDTVLRWVYDNARQGQLAYVPNIFRSELRWFHGAEISPQEFIEAAVYLRGRRLLEVGALAGNATVSYLARPSEDGGDLVRSRRTVREFVEDKNQPGIRVGDRGQYIGAGASVSGTNMASGDHNTQTATTGIDATALASLISELRVVAPKLGLDQEETDDLLGDVDDLQEAGDDKDKGGRVWRRIARTLRSVVSRANIELATKIVPEITHDRIEAVAKAGNEIFRALP
jgi:hypothetical protein